MFRRSTSPAPLKRWPSTSFGEVLGHVTWSSRRSTALARLHQPITLRSLKLDFAGRHERSGTTPASADEPPWARLRLWLDQATPLTASDPNRFVNVRPGPPRGTGDVKSGNVVRSTRHTDFGIMSVDACD